MKLHYPHITLRQFAFAYEDLPAFHAAYFMLMIVFAGIFDLGFFGVLIVAHIVLDFVKYRMILRHKTAHPFFAVFRESLADIALFMLAVCAVVYLNPLLPSIAVLTGSRQVHIIITRGLAVLLPKFSILHHSLRIVFNAKEYLHTPYSQLHAHWSLAECIYLSILVLSILSLIVAPVVLGIHVSEMQTMLMQQLIPWKV